jgi:hypothetical protein
MIKFFHRLFKPHCPSCIAEKECKSCETLRSLLETEKFEKQKLLNALLEKHQVPAFETTATPEPIQPAKFVPWRVRQQMLENEDKKRAELMRAKAREQAESIKSTERLERELLGEEHASDEQEAI